MTIAITRVTGAAKGLLLLLALVVALASPCSGEKLYKSRDASGNWHFSDRPPGGDTPVTVKQVRIGTPSSKVAIRNFGSSARPLLYAVNGYHGPVEVEIALQRSENVSTEPPLPARFLAPAAREVRTVRLWPTRGDQGWAYQYGYRAVPGDPAAVHRPEAPYRAPFPPGASFFISQAFFGNYSHRHPQSEYALDIAMPEGTPVCAARGGVVMEVASDFFTGGTDQEKYGQRANMVRVLHDDGTMAVYAHLRLETAQVVPGTRVVSGQVLAESGNTGYSSGPHLHFVVQKNVGMELRSIPFELLGADGSSLTPETGMLLSPR
ncbi:MAG TPA: M23 family metallopeptidase [Deferrimonas sp.]|jgi:murein DD-endopeptidase MepM/ murein hydrolase activator NlpD